VTRQDVHHDGEGRDVGSHNEYQYHELTKPKELAADWAENDHTSVGHAVGLGISDLELANHISCVAGDKA
jgi:hypothetical protein